MCETGRDCSPIAVGALVFQMVTSLIYLLVYIYHHVNYGVLTSFQHCGYVSIYAIALLDIIGGFMAILALSKCWPSNYFNYTPGMMCLLLASCLNCFVYWFFKSTLSVKEMRKYLREYVLAFHQPPEILQDLQRNSQCCGIFNYTDYPNGNIPDSCCGFQNCGADIAHYENRPGCVQPVSPGHSTLFAISATAKAYGIVCAPYLLVLTRIIVICIYRCGMLDNIANGIPVVIPRFSRKDVSESYFDESERASKATDYSTGDDKKHSVISGISNVPNNPHRQPRYSNNRQEPLFLRKTRDEDYEQLGQGNEQPISEVKAEKHTEVKTENISEIKAENKSLTSQLTSQEANVNTKSSSIWAWLSWFGLGSTPTKPSSPI